MRKALNIDRQCLTDILTKLETEQSFANRNALYAAASNEYQSARNLKISPALVYLRVKEWGVVLNTPVGKRGRQPGSGPVPRGDRGKKLKSNKSLLSLRQEMTRDKDAKPFLKILTKVENGSLKSVLKLNCLYCSNWQPKEIKLCSCETCPLHAFRPYQ